MTTSVIVGGARTPVGKLMGSLKDFSASDLGGIAIKAALEKANVPASLVDYVISGSAPLETKYAWPPVSNGPANPASATISSARVSQCGRHCVRGVASAAPTASSSTPITSAPTAR